jgi:ATP/ADP translocase
MEGILQTIFCLGVVGCLAKWIMDSWTMDSTPIPPPKKKVTKKKKAKKN